LEPVEPKDCYLRLGSWRIMTYESCLLNLAKVVGILAVIAPYAIIAGLTKFIL